MTEIVTSMDTTTVDVPVSDQLEPTPEQPKVTLCNKHCHVQLQQFLTTGMLPRFITCSDSLPDTVITRKIVTVDAKGKEKETELSWLRHTCFWRQVYGDASRTPREMRSLADSVTESLKASDIVVLDLEPGDQKWIPLMASEDYIVD